MGGVAIVGAAGFLGRALVESFRETDTVVERYTRARPYLSSAGELVPAVCATDTVYWLATSINPLIAEQEPALVIADRKAFATFLAKLGGRAASPRVVLVSSGGAVYGDDGQPPYKESDPVNPNSAYGRAKRHLEEMLLASDLPAVIVRVSNAYGPGQPVASGQGVIAHWLRAARRGENLNVYGNPSTTRDYVYVDDIARALKALHEQRGQLPQILNIGSGEPTSLGELADVVLGVINDERIELQVMEGRSFDVSTTWLDVTLARRTLGWAPEVALEDGIRRAWTAVSRLGDQLD